MQYLGKVWRQAWTSSAERWPKWREGAMRFILQAAIIFALLWIVPRFGAWDSHAKAGIITLAALVGSLVVTFVSDLLVAPARIDRDQVKEIRHLREAIEASAQSERMSAALSALWVRGVNVADGERDDWLREVTDFVERNMSSADIHKLTVSKVSGHGAVLEFLNSLASSPYPGGFHGKLRTVLSEYAMWPQLSDRYTDNTGTRDFRDRSRG